MAKRKDYNNQIRRSYEKDQQFDKKIARSELEAFIVKIDELGIQYDNENNTEELWVKIDLKNVSEEQKIKLNTLLNYSERNFTVKEDVNSIICYDKSVRSSY